MEEHRNQKIDKYKKVVFNFVKRKATSSGGAFFWLNKGFISQKFDKLINEQLKNYENKTKIHIISSLGAEFALISRHDDSAKDHIAYQGQLYVKQIALSDPDIKEFCDKKGIKTFEWVINGPVYMITRPNCRHYFQEITFEEAKENSVQNLLAKYNMSRKIGQRGMKQTLSSRKKSAIQMIKEYEKRLDLHKKLLEVDYNNQDIKDAIKKDKLLLQKWKTVI